VTAGSEEGIRNTVRGLELQFNILHDRTLRLSLHVKRSGLIDVDIWQRGVSTYHTVRPEISAARYPHGMVQPGVLVLSSTVQPVFTWAIRPAVMNVGGATDRPSPRAIWKAVEGYLRAPTSQSLPLDATGLERLGMMSAPSMRRVALIGCGVLCLLLVGGAVLWKLQA